MKRNPYCLPRYNNRVIYAREFFDLQLQFAQTVSVLSGLPLARTVLEYTNFYIRFGLERDFDPIHPVWQEYLAGLEDTNDRQQWTYRFYVTRSHPVAPPGLVATFGCFSYARLSSDRIRLHFQDAERDGPSPLGTERRDRRLAELAALFANIKQTMGKTCRVVGASWLYNVAAYRRLFPESYLATARAIQHRYRHMPLWGQFVNRHGEVRASMVCQFRERLGRQSSLERLDDCFPLQVLSLEAPVFEFCDFYGV
jgi:hypothetical protein